MEDGFDEIFDKLNKLGENLEVECDIRNNDVVDKYR